MSKLTMGLVDHLGCIEAHAHAARNAVNAGMNEAAIFNLETVIASLREAISSLDHERDIAESRAASERHQVWRSRDEYPWIVREPNGQCWGPFTSNEEAAEWAQRTLIETCDFEDVMPPPNMAHGASVTSKPGE